MGTTMIKINSHGIGSDPVIVWGGVPGAAYFNVVRSRLDKWLKTSSIK